MSEGRPNKSALKREAQRIRALADALVALKRTQLARVIDDEDIRRAVADAQQMTSHGALRRQKQYIARRLRELDVEPIQRKLASLAGEPLEDKRLFQQAERLRDALLHSAERRLPAALVEAGIEMDDTLARAVDTYHTKRNAGQRKAASREVFRQLHAQLGRLAVHSPDD